MPGHEAGQGAPARLIAGGRGGFDGVQGLRALAALAIAFLHVADEAAALPGGPALSRFVSRIPLEAGVDLFFVISGFVMAWAHWNDWGRPGALWPFIRRRLRRIVPLYWLLTAATVAVAAALPGRVSDGLRDGWSYVVASFLFLPWQRLDGFVQPVLRLGWTLEYEMLFYVLLAASLVLPRRAAFPLLLGLLAALALGHPLTTALPTPIRFWTDPIVLEFGLGLLVGVVARRGHRVTWPALLLAALCVAAAVVAPADTPRWLTRGVPAALLVFAALGVRQLPAWLVFAGDASYALYLVHPFPMRALRIACQHAGTGSFPYLAAAMTASLLLAAALHRWVERPIMRPARATALASAPPHDRGAIESPPI